MTVREKLNHWAENKTKRRQFRTRGWNIKLWFCPVETGSVYYMVVFLFVSDWGNSPQLESATQICDKYDLKTKDRGLTLHRFTGSVSVVLCFFRCGLTAADDVIWSFSVRRVSDAQTGGEHEQWKEKQSCHFASTCAERNDHIKCLLGQIVLNLNMRSGRQIMCIWHSDRASSGRKRLWFQDLRQFLSLFGRFFAL